MKSIQIILSIVAIALMSCNKTESLDKYYVTHQEKQGFMTIDVPASVLGIETNALSTSQKKAYESVAKLNFLGFKKSASDAVTFTTEKQKIKEILTNSKYQDLIRFQDDGELGIVKYIGNPKAIDELVLFGVKDADGFVIVRVLGDDMNPQSIFELLRSIEGKKINTEEIKKIANFFKN